MTNELSSATLEGYVGAFYQIAQLLGFDTARTDAPAVVFADEILPRIKHLLAMEARTILDALDRKENDDG